jgi:predicted dehydrogenase
VGFVGARHPHILQRARLLGGDERAEIVGFFEQDDDIAEQVEKRLFLERFTSLDVLLGQGLDVAIVEALDPDVPPLTRECIGRVKSVLMEKPGAGRPEAAYDLVGPCRAAGTVVEFGYEMHYAQFMAVLRQVLTSGCLGQVTLARLHGGNPVGCALELWQSLPEDLGGLGYTEGCHVIELANDLFGVPDAVSALTIRLPPGEILPSPYFKASLFSPPGEVTEVRVGTVDHEDVVTITMLYPDKVVTVDLTAWEGGNWVQDWAVQIYGTNGTALVDMGTETVLLRLREERGGFAAGVTAFEGGQAGLGYMYERQLDSLLNRTFGLGASEEVGLLAGMDVLRVLGAAYESAAAGAATMKVRGPL